MKGKMTKAKKLKNRKIETIFEATQAQQNQHFQPSTSAVYSKFILTLRNMHTVFPHIVSSLEYFLPLNSFLTPVKKLFKFLSHKGKINEETI